MATRYFLVVGRGSYGNWGGGETLKEAKANARKAGGAGPRPLVYIFLPDPSDPIADGKAGDVTKATINEYGDCVWPAGVKRELYDPGVHDTGGSDA